MSGSLRVSVAAIRRAARLAGEAEYDVLKVLYEDAGRPLPPSEAPPPDAPFSSYHSVPPGTPNAEVEGADVPETEPLTESSKGEDDDS